MNEYSQVLTQFLNCSAVVISGPDLEEAKRNTETLMQIVTSPQFPSVFLLFLVEMYYI